MWIRMQYNKRTCNRRTIFTGKQNAAANQSVLRNYSQPVVACLKLTIDTLKQGVKYVQN